MWYIIGQILGGVAVALGFVSYQMKTKRSLLLLQIAVSAVFCIHYYLIDATAGAALNFLSIVRNSTYYFKDKGQGVSKAFPITFMVISAIAGIALWEAWYSVFAVLGLVIHTGCMSIHNPQTVRKSILVTSPLVLLYDAFALSFGGMIYESVAIVSSIVGIVRYRKSRDTVSQ